MDNLLLHVNISLASAFLNDSRVRILLCGRGFFVDPHDLASGDISPRVRISISLQDSNIIDELFGPSNPVSDELRYHLSLKNITFLVLKPAWNPNYETSRGWFAICSGRHAVFPEDDSPRIV